MNHPFEFLAEYVDGSLAESERPVVEAHLDSCQQCRAEVELARSARLALASLADEPVPAGLGERAIEEASEAAAAAPGTPRWYRVAGIAAAAAVVGLLAIALPRFSGEEAPAAGSFEVTAPADAAAPLSGLQVESQATDYTSESLGELATNEREALLAGEAAADATAARDDPDRVLDCLRDAYPHIQGRPVRLIRARFQGEPAYIGVFAAGSGGEDPPDTWNALAATVRGCRLVGLGGPIG